MEGAKIVSCAGAPLKNINASPKTLLSLGEYSRGNNNVNGNDAVVTNIIDDPIGRSHFDEGLRLMFSYFHEEAAIQFLACIARQPHCALAHALVALCHGPNYNFTGDTYYTASHYVEDGNDARQNCLKCFGEDDDDNDIAVLDGKQDSSCSFPCQVVAEYHSALAIKKVRDLIKKNDEQQHKDARNITGSKHRLDDTDTQIGRRQQPQKISGVETELIFAIRQLFCHPGIEPSLATQSVGRPYADAMKNVYASYPSDPEVAHFYAESLMVLNAWKLYDYPSGQPVSDDVPEIRRVLEKSLEIHPHHAGLCHLYVHLSEMSDVPEKALPACETLKTRFPDSGHLIHMATHIYILIGDYEACVKYNDAAIHADSKLMRVFPITASTSSFIFGYIVHDYHMLIYGAILGGMEMKAMDCAMKLNLYLTENLFIENPQLGPFIEAYATMDIHVLVRFGRWQKILELDLPINPDVMIYRASSLRYARAVAYANLGDDNAAKEEARRFEEIRDQTDITSNRYLHNNTIMDILNVKSLMIKGEIEYFGGRHDEAFKILREAVSLQDNLCFDEPWGVMQPIRHALGGLLLKEGCVEEAEEIFRMDLTRHPNNPWALVGLVACLEQTLKSLDNEKQAERGHVEEEYEKTLIALQKQRKSEWADYNVTHSCMCVNTKCCAKAT